MNDTNKIFMNLHSIGGRLSLAFAALLCLALLLAGYGMHRLSTQSARIEHLANVDNAMVEAIMRVTRGVDLRAIAARNLVLVGPGDAQAHELARISQGQRDIDAGIDTLATLMRSDTREALAQLQQLRALEARYRTIAEEVVSLATSGDTERSVEVLTLRCMPMLSEVLAHLDAFQARVMGGARQASEQVQVDSQRSMRWMAAIALVAFFSGALLAWGITRSIVCPLRQALAVAQAVAEGDLAYPIDVRHRDETGQLLESLRRMSTALARTVGAVREHAGSVALATDEIARGNDDLSLRTEQQASNLQRTATSMTQMQTGMRDNAKATVHATRLASEAAEVANRGSDAVQQVAATMTTIRASSARIADIVVVIDGIAFQTNLLAVNAGVEAARAGHEGRGFAVVAGEVRTLAQRSAAAAREVRTLIEESVASVANGDACVNNAGRTLTEIVARVGQVSTLVGEIRDTNQLQHGGIDAIADAVQRLDAVTQQNAALVEQSSAAAHSLRQRAAQLADAVAVFRLPEVAHDAQ